MTVRVASRLAAVLFVASAVLFVVGVVVEPDSHADVPASSADPGGHGEGGEEGQPEAGTPAHVERSENTTVYGIDMESSGTVAAAVVLSVLVAAALWLRESRPVAFVAVAAAVAFAALDVGEIARQLDASRSGMALLAGTVAAGHVAAAWLGSVAWRGQASA